jgi:hypothetical protein
MKRIRFSAYGGVLVVGLVATAALLLEQRLPVSENIHFLLQLLWLGVAISGLFLLMLGPVASQQLGKPPASAPPTQDEAAHAASPDDIAEWDDPDRQWLQQHPDDSNDNPSRTIQ